VSLTQHTVVELRLFSKEGMLKHNKRQLCLKDPKVETERNRSGKKLVVCAECSFFFLRFLLPASKTLQRHTVVIDLPTEYAGLTVSANH